MTRTPGLYVQAALPTDHPDPDPAERDAAQAALEREAAQAGVRLVDAAVFTTVPDTEPGRYLLVAIAGAEVAPLPPAGGETDTLIRERFGLVPAPEPAAPERMNPLAVTTALEGVRVELSDAERRAAARTGLARGMAPHRLRRLLDMTAAELTAIATGDEGLVRAA